MVSSETKEMILTKQLVHPDFAFITIPSRIPSVPKLPEKWCGSTGPGSRKDKVNWPGGQRFWVCISKTWEYLYTVVSPVIVTPDINTFPSVSTSHRSSSAGINLSYVSYRLSVAISETQCCKNYQTVYYLPAKITSFSWPI